VHTQTAALTCSQGSALEGGGIDLKMSTVRLLLLVMMHKKGIAQAQLSTLQMRTNSLQLPFHNAPHNAAGGIYEYTVENASRTDTPSLERRTAALGAALLGGGGQLGALAAAGGAVRGRVGGKGRQLQLSGLQPSAGLAPGALRLLLFGELVSGVGFERDRLYVEWRISFDPEVWQLQGQGEGRDADSSEPGLIKGVSHVSKVVCYPEDRSSTEPPPTWVAHWVHPLEAEWVAHTAPAPGKWPVLTLAVGSHNELGCLCAGCIAKHNKNKQHQWQSIPTLPTHPPTNQTTNHQVCSYDLWDRYTCEGYGWLQLTPVPGSSTHVAPTWKPLGALGAVAASHAGSSETAVSV